MRLDIEIGTKNEILRKKSIKVDKITKKITKLIKDMFETMKKDRGVGLAAPQIGKNIRLIVVLLVDKRKIAMINPEIIEYSKNKVKGEEGCLSLPNVWGQVERYESIMLSYLDGKNNKITLKLDGFNARVVQHEIDHLNGVLFTDYLDIEEELINTKIKEATAL